MSQAEAVLITGVSGSGKSSVAAEIAYLLEQQESRFTLLDLDHLSWAGPDTGDRATEMRSSARTSPPSSRTTGASASPSSSFPTSSATPPRCRPSGPHWTCRLGVVRLAVPLAVIEQRLAIDVTRGRRDDLHQAAELVATAEGVGQEDVTIVNDRPVDVVTQEIMTFLGWP